MAVEHRDRATFGAPAYLTKPKPSEFLKSHANEPILPDPASSTRTIRDKTKPSVPTRAEKPVMNLVSNKNFITTNAVEAILSQPKKTGQGEMNWTAKKDYGRVPNYLQKNKAEAEAQRIARKEEAALMEQQQLADAGVVKELGVEERELLLKHLKIKWAQVNTAYQKMTFTLDNPAKKKRKADYEKELSEVERDIKMLEKGETILVVD